MKKNKAIGLEYFSLPVKFVFLQEVPVTATFFKNKCFMLMVQTWCDTKRIQGKIFSHCCHQFLSWRHQYFLLLYIFFKKCFIYTRKYIYSHMCACIHTYTHMCICMYIFTSCFISQIIAYYTYCSVACPSPHSHNISE